MQPDMSRRSFIAGVAGAIALLACGKKAHGHSPSGRGRLDRLDLLQYRDADGAVRRAASPRDWLRRRAEILRGMEAIMGPLPAGSNGPPRFEVSGEVDCGTYVRRALTYEADPGVGTPAYLLVPKRVLAAGGRAPAVLCLHPTDDRIGPDVAVGLGGRPNRAYAAELAERGLVTFAPAYPLLARYQPDVRGLGYASGTMKAIHDNRRGIDLLESLPFVAAGGVGAIGHSLGGHNAVFTAAFDQRIRVVVSSCGLDLFSDYYGGDPGVWQPEKGWCQLRYMPRLLEYAGRLEQIPFDFAEVVGALAPRVCFLSAPTGDANFRWQSVDRIAEAARRVYALHGSSDRLFVEHPDSDHDFPEPMRLEAYELLTQALVAD